MSDNPAAPTTEPTIEPAAPINGEPLPPQSEPGQGNGAIPPEPSLEPVQGAEPPAPEPPEGGEEEEGISSFSDLTEFVQGTLGEDQQLGDDWLDGLKVQVKVNGEPIDATFKDLVDGFQMREASERRLTEAKARAKEITEGAAQKAQALDAQFATAAELIKGAEAFLTDDIANANLAELRDKDPAEYAAKHADFTKRREQIDALKNKAVEEYQKGVGQQQQAAQQHRAELRQKEEAALITKLPDWRDEGAAKSEKKQLVQYLITEGFSEQDVMNTIDHRLILMARKAMLYDKGKSRSEAMKKRVVKVPKVIKPGAKKSEKRAQKPNDPASILYG